MKKKLLSNCSRSAYFPHIIVFLLLTWSIAQAIPFVTNLVLGSDTSTIRRPGSYGKPNQSRIWYNSHQDRWDALIPKDDNNGGSSASDHFILKDISGNQEFTLVELEDRDFGRSDVFWDDTNMQLYVLSSHPTQSQFWRVGFDDLSDNYEINVGTAGTGVDIPGLTHPATSLGGSSPATLYVSPNGNIWVAVMKDNELLVQHSTDGGATWMLAPINLDSSVQLGVTTWSHFENNGSTFIGLFAGENGENNAETNVFFWYINQDNTPSSFANWVDDSANIPAPFGNEQSDDHVSAAIDSTGNQYFAVKTESGSPVDPLIKLYKRTPDGIWSQFEVTETQEVPEQSRPSIVIDNTNNELYIFTNGAENVSPNEREGSYVSAPLDSLEDLASTPLTPVFSEANIIFTDLITPRQNVDAISGIAVLANNRTDETVWFSQIEIQTGTIPTPDVIGLSLAEAEQDIIAAGLIVGTITEANSSTVPSGNIISQNPAGGSLLAPNSAIDLVVSLGSPLFIDLGEAGDFTVFGLKKAKVKIEDGNPGVFGNVGIGPKVEQELKDGFITGNLFIDPSANIKNSGTSVSGETVFKNLSPAVDNALELAFIAKNLTPTQSYGSIKKSKTIFSDGQLTVIKVKEIELKNGKILTLRGGSNDEFIINIKKNLKLENSKIILEGGLKTSKVLFNFLNKDGKGEFKKGSKAAGIFLAAGKDGTFKIEHSDTVIEGSIIAGKEISIKKSAQIISAGE